MTTPHHKCALLLCRRAFLHSHVCATSIRVCVPICMQCQIVSTQFPPASLPRPCELERLLKMPTERGLRVLRGSQRAGKGGGRGESVVMATRCHPAKNLRLLGGGARWKSPAVAASRSFKQVNETFTISPSVIFLSCRTKQNRTKDFTPQNVFFFLLWKLDLIFFFLNYKSIWKKIRNIRFLFLKDSGEQISLLEVKCNWKSTLGLTKTTLLDQAKMNPFGSMKRELHLHQTSLEHEQVLHKQK